MAVVSTREVNAAVAEVVLAGIQAWGSVIEMSPFGRSGLVNKTYNRAVYSYLRLGMLIALEMGQCRRFEPCC